MIDDTINDAKTVAGGMGTIMVRRRDMVQCVVERQRRINASENQIAVCQPNGTVRLDVRLENETVWLTQAQLCDLFQRDVSVISRHIKNIFAEGELEKEGNLYNYLGILGSSN